MLGSASEAEDVVPEALLQVPEERPDRFPQAFVAIVTTSLSSGLRCYRTASWTAGIRRSLRSSAPARKPAPAENTSDNQQTRRSLFTAAQALPVC